MKWSSASIFLCDFELVTQGCPQKKKVEWYFYKIYKINKTTRWEVVKNSASPKRLFFFRLRAIFGCFWSLDQEVMQNSQVEFCYWYSFHGGRHPWLGFFDFFSKNVVFFVFFSSEK